MREIVYNIRKIEFWCTAGMTVCMTGLLVLPLTGCESEKKAPAAKEMPRRIVSFAPSLTRQMYTLGAGRQLIANTIYCEDPEGTEKPHIGTVADVNVEKVVSLQPDCILTSKLTTRKQVEKLQKIDMRIEVFDRPNSFEQLCDQFYRVARLTGKTDTATHIITRARSCVDSIIRSTDTLSRPRVFVQVGKNPLFTVSRESFIHDYIRTAGGENIAADAGSGLYSIEKVVQRNPEFIFISTMGMEGEKEKKEWMKYRSIAAVAHDNVYVLDDDRLCSPTPEQFAEMAEKMAHIIHPQK